MNKKQIEAKLLSGNYKILDQESGFGEMSTTIQFCIVTYEYELPHRKNNCNFKNFEQEFKALLKKYSYR